MKTILMILKRFILCSFILYGYNLIAVNFNSTIPINIFTILFTAILGVSGMIALILFKILVLWGSYGKFKFI